MARHVDSAAQSFPGHGTSGRWGSASRSVTPAEAVSSSRANLELADGSHPGACFRESLLAPRLFGVLFAEIAVSDCSAGS